MNWWTLFLRVRRVLFAFLAIASFLWAIALSVYISRQWPYFDLLRRILVLAVIGINAFTSVLLYLMIVVVFRVWLDFGRMVFLLLLHVGTAIVFMIYGRNFPCTIFASKQLCMVVNWSFVLGSLTVAGLHLIYILYLLVMVRVPRPLPASTVTPNLLLDSDPSKRRGSTSSVNSATELLGDSTGSLTSQPADVERLGSQTAPKTDYTNNGFPQPVSRVQTGVISYARPGDNYGSMGIPRGPPLGAWAQQARAPNVRSVPTPASGIPRSLKSSVSRTMEQRRSRASAVMPPSSLPNPFIDPLSRYGSPASTYSTVSHNGQPMEVENGYSLERYQPMVPMLPPQSAGYRSVGYGSAQAPSLPSTPAYSVRPRQEPYSFPPLENPFGPPGIRSAGERLRVTTATPHSMHSVAPSWHVADHAPTTSRPQPAHVRGSSEYSYRSYTASPRMQSVVDAPLPNPFPETADRGEVRRFGSMSGPDGGAYHGGSGGTYLSNGRDARNAAHLVGALGMRPPRAEAAMTDPVRWKQLVLSAAASTRVD